MTFRALSVTLLLLTALGCGGTAEIGGACDTAGNTDECVDGAICTNESSSNVCRKICTEQSQCSATENCNGVSNGSTKSCQPK